MEVYALTVRGELPNLGLRIWIPGGFQVPGWCPPRKGAWLGFHGQLRAPRGEEQASGWARPSREPKRYQQLGIRGLVPMKVGNELVVEAYLGA